MKKISKIICANLILIIAFVLACSLFYTKADTVKTDDSQYNYTTTNETTRELVSGVDYTVNTGYTTRSSTQYDQRVNIFTADFSENSNIKIATWNSLNTTGTGFTRRALLDIAKDYEKNNPGWVVLAGINADQYYQKTGTGLGTDGSVMYQPQPYYPMISNGENWFVATPYGYSSNVAGFKNDGSKTPLVNGARTNKGFYIHIYDSKNQEIGFFPLDGLNCDLGANGAVVLSSYQIDANTKSTITRNGNNDIYVIGKADLSYVSCTTAWSSWDPHAVDGFFGKGVISEVSKSVTLNGGNKFAIETNNDALKAKLSVGTYVKVQIDYDDGFSGIEEAIGYHTVQRRNGQDQNVANSYNSRAYPRSVFGCDANGKIYLMTCFGDNASPLKGLYAQEFNAVCKKYGITDAWQMDGGGSVTCIARDENGILDYADACIEASHSGTLTYSSYRYVLSGLFIVMKVPEATIEVVSKSSDSVQLALDVEKLVGNYDEAMIKLLNTTTSETLTYPVPLDENKIILTIDNLAANTDYAYELYVQNNGYPEQRSFINGTLNTLKEGPTITSLVAVQTEDGIKVTLTYEDSQKAMVKLYGWFGDRKYSFSSEGGTATLTIRPEYSIFDLKVSAECVLDKNVNKYTDLDLEVQNANYPVVSFFDYPNQLIEQFINQFFE